MQVDLRLSCTKLASRDGFGGKSDPFCVVFERDDKGSWREIDRTEVVNNNHDPQFVHAILVSFNFEKQQRFKVAVYDADQAHSDVHKLQLPKQDHLGSIEFDLAEVARSADHQIRQPLVGAKAKGTCTVRGEERVTFKRMLTVDISGQKLAKRDGYASATGTSLRKHWHSAVLKFRAGEHNRVLAISTAAACSCSVFGGKSDPFVRISRRTETTLGTGWQPVLQTGVMKNSSSPTWRQVEMPLARVCMGDMESKLLVEVCSTQHV